MTHWLNKRLTSRRYTLRRQILAALLGGFLLRCGYETDTHLHTYPNAVCAVFAEFIGTFALVFVVLNTLTVKKREGNGYYGLAIGLSSLAFAGYAVIAYLTGHAVFADYLNLLNLPEAGELTVYCAAVVGAGIGFLWFNAHPARIFMGDTGSLALGGALGTVAILVKKEFLLVVIGGMFVAEALSVMAQVTWFKRTGGKRLFRMAPLHHHFELTGWSETQVVVRFWIIGVLLLLLGMSSIKLQ